MRFYTSNIYHVYNQGNGRQPIFFKEDNYEYFLWKMRAYLLPFGELISWCLMPNHYHWQFWVEQNEISRKELREHVIQTEILRRKTIGLKTEYNVGSRGDYKSNKDTITLNEAIGILQRSYTGAINRAFGLSGSLFRQGCKSKCGWIDQFITQKEIRQVFGNINSRLMYNQICFEYIHNNPVAANMVKRPTDYEWSSAKEYAGLIDDPLANLEMGLELMQASGAYRHPAPAI